MDLTARAAPRRFTSLPGQRGDSVTAPTSSQLICNGQQSDVGLHSPETGKYWPGDRDDAVTAGGPLQEPSSFWQLSCLLRAALWLSLARIPTPLWSIPFWTEELWVMRGALSAPNGISRVNGGEAFIYKADPHHPHHPERAPDISPLRPVPTPARKKGSSAT